MSYCGTCGGFYWEGCPRRQEGVCAPAPNPYEERAVELFATAVAAYAEVSGMLAQNQTARRLDQPPVYLEEDFGAIADGLRADMKRKP